ncbi:MAG: ABC transporter ATP-binding protein [Caldilineaceae bacterium]|nr:ABC transporter ATP-binding protein [Caldilineaceae bacterium]MBP8109222.1 ABC transporter ATP-binding protein [Caldilineaceae bacterium]MBP8122725.1 ABC transporter ATP-binding protein [Caldilineaceae bacterium]MBP9072195.1 ABC transporter ATP-binding protein [Caldilineaceae bacterium]
MLKVNNIEVVYSDVILVLRGVSLAVGDGQIVSLLGANGAGKSTTLKAISGLLRTQQGDVTRGNVTWDGQRIDQMTPDQIVQLGIVQVLEGRPLFRHLTVEENLLTGSLFRPGAMRSAAVRQDLEQVYHFFPRLLEFRRRTAGYLSGGEQQMVVIGRALMSRPKLMLLDEPSLGLAPLLVQSIFEIIRRINQESGVSILLVEQNANVALQTSEYAYVMETGRVVLDGESAQLAQNADIKEFYLGLTQVGERKSYRDVKHYKRRKRWIG